MAVTSSGDMNYLTIGANSYKVVDPDALHAPTTWYGVCGTTSSTAAKSVTCANFVLQTGAVIGIYFSTGNIAATPTLNINNTGAKSIYIGNDPPDATTNVLKWSGGTMLYFMYDGSYYRYMTAISSGTVIAPPRGANTWYGTSSIAAGTAMKTSTIDNFVLVKGTVACIKFTYANTANAPTLNINSTGEKAIYYNGAVTSSSNKLTWDAGETVTFIYTGSYYYFVCKSTAAVDISGKVDKDVTNVSLTQSIHNDSQGIYIGMKDSNSERSIGIGEEFSLLCSGDGGASSIILVDDAILIGATGSGGVIITDVVTPINSTDAANKAYVDGLVSALTNTEIDNAVAAAVTVANGNNIQY